MKILIPLYKGFDLLDVAGPCEMFFWAGFEVQLVAEVPGAVVSISGYSWNVPDGLPPMAEPCDALWIPGGDPNELKRIMDDPARTYLDCIVRQAAVSTWVCSVCEGALLAAKAGLLNGRTVTTHWAFIPYLLEQYQGQITVADGHPRFVQDGNVLTGGGISSCLDEALKLIELLAGTEAACDVQRSTQYYPEPPVSSEITNVIKAPPPFS
jgi:transcriptional regulator GlxA family with amidase domain